MYGVVRSRWAIFVMAGIISLFLSYWTSVRSAVINADAICYLQSAQSMTLGLSFVTHLCDQSKWPFYSFLIYSAEQATKISYYNSAQLLNALFSLLSVTTFIAIIHYLKGTARIMCWGAFVILLAHEFNAVREYIVRDHGFWAFYLLSLLFLLKFFRTWHWAYALSWSASLILATLFRIEGAFFLLSLPFLTFFMNTQSFKQRSKSFLQLNVFSLLGIVLLSSWVLLHHQNNLDHIGRINEIEYQLLNGFRLATEHFNTSAYSLGEHLLNQYSEHDAPLILFLVLIAWYLVALVSNLSIIYAGLVIYAWWRKIPTLEYSDKWVVYGYLAINVLITAVFLVENMFLSKRYLLALSLTLMLWVPFALDNLWQQWSTKKISLMLILALIFIFSLSGIFDFGYSKKYISDAGKWLETHVPANASLYSNDYQVMYYSKHFGNDIFIKAHEFLTQNAIADDKWKQFNYLALRFNKNAKENNTQKLGRPVQVFANKRGDEVSIYKVQ